MLVFGGVTFFFSINLFSLQSFWYLIWIFTHFIKQGFSMDQVESKVIHTSPHTKCYHQSCLEIIFNPSIVFISNPEDSEWCMYYLARRHGQPLRMQRVSNNNKFRLQNNHNLGQSISFRRCKCQISRITPVTFKLTSCRELQNTCQLISRGEF